MTVGKIHLNPTTPHPARLDSIPSGDLEVGGGRTVAAILSAVIARPCRCSQIRYSISPLDSCGADP